MNQNKAIFATEDEINAYNKLCLLLEDDSNHYEYLADHIDGLAPLVSMIKRLTTMVDIMAPHLTAPVLDEKGVLKYYAEEAQKILDHDEKIANPNYWAMKEDYERRHKND